MLLQCSAVLASSGRVDGTRANGMTWRDRVGAPSSDARRPKTWLLLADVCAESSITGWDYRVDTRGSHHGREVDEPRPTGACLCAARRRDPAETRAQRPGWRNNLNRRMLRAGQDLVCSYDAVDRALHWAGWLAETYTELPAWQDQGTQPSSLPDRRHGWVGLMFELVRIRPPRRLLTRPSVSSSACHVALFRWQGPCCRGPLLPPRQTAWASRLWSR